MKKTLTTAVATLLASATLLAMPVFAQDQNTTNLGQEVKACNMTARDATKAVQQDFKDKKVTKDERNSKIKDINKTRLSCIRDVYNKVKQARMAKVEAAKTAREQKKQERLAALKKAQEERRAKVEGARTKRMQARQKAHQGQ